MQKIAYVSRAGKIRKQLDGNSSGWPVQPCRLRRLMVAGRRSARFVRRSVINPRGCARRSPRRPARAPARAAIVSSAARCSERRGSAKRRHRLNAPASAAASCGLRRSNGEHLLADERVAGAVGAVESAPVAARECRDQRAHAVGIAGVEFRMREQRADARERVRTAATTPGARTTCRAPAARRATWPRSARRAPRARRRRCG